MEIIKTIAEDSKFNYENKKNGNGKSLLATTLLPHVIATGDQNLIKVVADMIPLSVDAWVNDKVDYPGMNIIIGTLNESLNNMKVQEADFGKTL